MAASGASTAPVSTLPVAIAAAVFGRSAPVAIEVAMAFAVS